MQRLKQKSGGPDTAQEEAAAKASIQTKSEELKKKRKKSKASSDGERAYHWKRARVGESGSVADVD